MPAIDWYYRRGGDCTSCRRADAWLDARGVTVRETVDATKQRYERADLDALFRGAKRVVIAKGQKTVAFSLVEGQPLPEKFVRVALGPSQKLRAPTVRVGTTWFVGFVDESWSRELGGG